MSKKIIKIDTREPNKWRRLVAKEFERLSYEILYEALDYGDYESSCVIVERKDIKDLLSSTLSGRLDRQMNGLSNIAEMTGKVPVLLVHGNVYDLFTLKSKLKKYPDPMTVFGSLASVIARYGILVMWIEDYRDAAIIMSKFISKVDSGKWLMPRTKNELALLSRLLGLPIKTTKKLLRETGGTIRALVNSDEKRYKKVKGIGKVKARKISEVFDKKLI